MLLDNGVVLGAGICKMQTICGKRYSAKSLQKFPNFDLEIKYQEYCDLAEKW